MVADSNNKTSSAIEASREELLDLGLDGPIKIGRGTIGNRFKAAQTSNYRALYLRLITRFDDSVDLRVVQAERILHKVFHFLNIRGEWFEVHDSLEWFIGVPIKWPVLLEWLRSREDPQAYLLEAFSAYANNINNPKPGEFSF